MTFYAKSHEIPKSLYFFLYPLIIAVGSFFGFIEVTMTIPAFLPVFLTGAATLLVPQLLFSTSEEWAWRGYLEPRLSRIGVTAVPRHILVGLMWSVWHFPFILGAVDYTAVPLPTYLTLFTIDTIAAAFVYGQMREASRTVWPAVIYHAMGNILVISILEGNFIIYNNEVLGGIASGSILMIVINSLLAAAIWFARQQQTRQIEVGVGYES